MNDISNNILFVILLKGKLYGSPEHLGVSYLASILRKNSYQVKIVTFSSESNDIQELYKEILDYSPFLIGFTTFDELIDNILLVANNIKKEFPSVHITLGGPTASFWDEKILHENDFIDSIIRKEGEETIVELASRIKSSKSLNNCKGLSFRAGNAIIRNEEREPIDDLDLYPYPARDIIISKNSVFARVSTTRGCAGKCSFCAEKFLSIYKNKFWYRIRSAENVVEELYHVYTTLNINAFVIVDPSFEDPGKKGKERLRKIAEGILEKGIDINYLVHFRAESFKEEDRELLELLFKSGLEVVGIGIESGNESDIILYNKVANIEDNKRSIELMRSVGIYVMTNFIMFNPFSTIEGIKKNADFLLNSGVSHKLDYYASRLAIYSGTQMMFKMKEENLLPEGYSYNSGIFNYRFQDEKIGRLCRILNDTIHKYNIETDSFDLSMGIFTSRLKRRYQNELSDEILLFENKINDIRSEMGKNNYIFFNKVLELIMDKWDENIYNEYVEKYINPYIQDQLGLIKSTWFKFGHRAMKKNISLKKLTGKVYA